MKKTITLIFALFLSVGVVFAQNTSTVSQNGYNADATVTQSGSNEATVNQASDIQAIYTTIDQTGTNTATVTQNHNRSFFLFNAGSMNANITQDGSANEATIEQGPASGFSPIGDLSATINQSGGDHVAGQSQVGVGHVALITQSSSSNEASQNQTGLANEATVNQSGNNNIAMQDQSGLNGLSEALATQSGDYNSVIQTQGILGGHSASATQNGSGSAGDINSVEQIQYGLSQVSIVTQSGAEGNITLTEQYGSNHYSDISQDGALNSATLLQDGGSLVSGHQSTITQNGTSNTTTVTQNN